MRIGKYGKLFHWDNTSLGVGNIRRFTIFEIKYLGGIIVNIFNTVGQDRFHSHAFHAVSLMLRGHYFEEVIVDNKIVTKKIEKSRFIPKNYIHKITVSTPNAMSVTFEGPWGSTWDEYFDNGRVKTYTWGRKLLFDSKYFNPQKRDFSERYVDSLKEEIEALRLGCDRVKVLDNPAMRWIHRALKAADQISKERRHERKDG